MVAPRRKSCDQLRSAVWRPRPARLRPSLARQTGGLPGRGLCRRANHRQSQHLEPHQPCHQHSRQRAQAAKRGVLQARGFPLEMPATALGEICMKPSTMTYRNLLAVTEDELARRRCRARALDQLMHQALQAGVRRRPEPGALAGILPSLPQAGFLLRATPADTRPRAYERMACRRRSAIADRGGRDRDGRRRFRRIALQRIPAAGVDATRLLAVVLAFVWAVSAGLIIVSALKEGVAAHTNPVLGSFAIGTRVAGTAVMARMLMLAAPTALWLAKGALIASVGLWAWFFPRALRNLARVLISREIRPAGLIADQRRHHHEEVHGEAVLGDDHIVKLMVVAEEAVARGHQVVPHNDRERAADQPGADGEGEIDRGCRCPGDWLRGASGKGSRKLRHTDGIRRQATGT